MISSKKRGISNFNNTRLSQVWVETVVYTLITLSIMGIVLSVVTPKINQMNDKIVITQSTDSLNKFNEQIGETLTAAGNKREILLSVKKGEYVIDSSANKVSYILKDTSYMAGQPGLVIKNGDVNMLTLEKSSKKYDIYLTIDYSKENLNIVYQNNELNKTLFSSPTAYRLVVEYLGNSKINVDSE